MACRALIGSAHSAACRIPIQGLTQQPLLLLVICEAASFPWCRAFQNGRAIAKAGAPEAMLAAMRDRMTRAERAPQLVTAVCGALRRIAVNDDICTEYADAGGVAVTMQVSATCIGHHPMQGEHCQNFARCSAFRARQIQEWLGHHPCTQERILYEL